MRDMYKIFHKLDEMKVYHCLQCAGKHDYYNLAVHGPKGLSHHFSDGDINKVEESLKVLWGHLLKGDNTSKVKLVFSTPVPKMPVPAGFPTPG